MSDHPATESIWHRRIRRLASWVIASELAGIALFIALLLVGEQSRLTLTALYVPRQPVLAAAIVGTLLALLTPRRRLLLPLQCAVCLIVFFPVMGFSVGTSRSGVHPIHLASYNVYFGKQNRPALLDEITAMHADILLIQAAYDSLGPRLRERLPGQIVEQTEEFLMATRFPVREAVVPIPPRDKGSPMYAKYVIDTPYGALRVYSVHPYTARQALFGEAGSAENVAAREMQISTAVDAARSDTPPFVLVGDTNLPGCSSLARQHLGKLHDAWDEVGLGFGYTFPAKHPWMRIDRALAGDGVRFLGMRVAPQGASDHRAILVDFELTDTP